MLRAGELNARLTLLSGRTGTPPTWSEIGRLWAKIIEPKSAGRAEQQSILASGSSMLELRPRTDIQPGCLLHGSAGWYLIEEVLPERGLLRLAARRLSGQAATYHPKSGADSYPITAFLAPDNALIGSRNETRHMVDLIQPELVSPFARLGDQIALRGQLRRIDGIVEGSDNGVTLRVMVV